MPRPPEAPPVPPEPIVFGPVPSRRLGRSLGVSTIPPKVCSYSCAYCQVGRTTALEASRRPFFEPAEILAAVRARVGALREAREPLDYVSLVPDGEPTLDSRMGRTIRLLSELGVPVAVITNSSLLWQEEVRRELAAADWVSVKVDAAREGAWRRLNRPHRSLRLDAILEGTRRFRDSFNGTMVTETMMVEGVNDDEEEIAATAAVLSTLRPSVAYLSVPTRPPAERWARPAGEGAVLRAHEQLAAAGLEAAILASNEGVDFSGSGRTADDLLAITAVHPMRREAVEEFVARSGADWSVVSRLVEEGRLVQVDYRRETFLVRRFARAEQRRGPQEKGVQ